MYPEMIFKHIVAPANLLNNIASKRVPAFFFVHNAFFLSADLIDPEIFFEPGSGKKAAIHLWSLERLPKSLVRFFCGSKFRFWKICCNHLDRNHTHEKLRKKTDQKSSMCTAPENHSAQGPLTGPFASTRRIFSDETGTTQEMESQRKILSNTKAKASATSREERRVRDQVCCSAFLETKCQHTDAEYPQKFPDMSLKPLRLP